LNEYCLYDEKKIIVLKQKFHCKERITSTY
jgi:vancomycin permeability regulator SanA